MKKYIVTIVLVMGYHWDEADGYDLNAPKLKEVEFEVLAMSEQRAIDLAKEKETSGHSIWESYASEY